MGVSVSICLCLCLHAPCPLCSFCLPVYLSAPSVRLTVSQVPVATLILSSPPGLKDLASSAISRSRLKRCCGVLVGSPSPAGLSIISSSLAILSLIAWRLLDSTASSSLRSEMDRVMVGGMDSMQSEKVVQTGGDGDGADGSAWLLDDDDDDDGNRMPTTTRTTQCDPATPISCSPSALPFSCLSSSRNATTHGG